jgi:hypothetical protein
VAHAIEGIDLTEAPPFGHEPQPTTISVCGQCQCNADYPIIEVKTMHFVDFATDKEMSDPRWSA